MTSRIGTFSESQLQEMLYPTFPTWKYLDDSVESPLIIEADFSNLNAMTNDVRNTQRIQLTDISIPSKFSALYNRLDRGTKNLPKEYQQKFALPFLNHLLKRWNEENNYTRLQNLTFSPIELDAIKAILLNGNVCPRTIDNGSFCQTTKAAQELVSDLHDEFAKGAFPYRRTTPSLHIWSQTVGPYTYNINALETLGLKTSMVVMPIVNSLGGLFAWTTYAHEVAGHNNLHARACIDNELQTTIFNKLHYGSSHITKDLAEYWSDRSDETLSDVLGLLTLGPAAGIGLVGYIRGLAEDGRLRANGNASDFHTSNLVRGLLAAQVIKHLPFSNAKQWSASIEKEVLRDYPTHLVSVRGKLFREFSLITLGNQKYDYNEVMSSVDAMAKVALFTPFACYGNQSLFSLRAWNNADMEKTSRLMDYMRYGGQINTSYRASHVVAAATFAGLKKDAKLTIIFQRMVDILSKIHKSNTHWKFIA